MSNADPFDPFADPFTEEARLCQNGTVVSGPGFRGTPFPCTGHAHWMGAHFRCTDPYHVVQLSRALRAERDPMIDRLRDIASAGRYLFEGRRASQQDWMRWVGWLQANGEILLELCERTSRGT